MSPTERELRAALRHGEGETLDPTRVVLRARGARDAQRMHRNRVLSVAASVVVVVGVGTGIGFWAAANPSDEMKASSAKSAAAGGADYGGASAGGTSAAASAAAAGSGAIGAGTASGPSVTTGPIAPGPLNDAAKIVCPSAVPDLATKDGTGALITVQVEAVKVCVYQRVSTAGVDAVSAPVDTIFTGPNATDIATSLNSASTAALPVPTCADTPGPVHTVTLAVYGVSPGGAVQPPVVVTLGGCGPSMPTNGTNIRYGWSPSGALADYLAQFPLGASGSGTATLPTAPSSGANGTPVR